MRQIRLSVLVAIAGLTFVAMTGGLASANPVKNLNWSAGGKRLTSGSHTEWTVSSLSLTGKSGTIACKRLEPPWKDIVEEPIKEGGAWNFSLSSESTSSECSLNDEPVEVTLPSATYKVSAKLKTGTTVSLSGVQVVVTIPASLISCTYSAKKPKGTFEVGEPGSPVPFLPTFTNQKLKVDGKTKGCEKTLVLNMAFEVSSEGETVLVERQHGLKEK